MSQPETNNIHAVQISKTFLDNSTPPNKLPVTVIYLEQKGGLLIRDLWARGADFILDMRVANMGTASYLHKSTDKSLDVAERDNKRKYLDSCL